MPESLKIAISKTYETYAFYKSYLVYRPPEQTLDPLIDIQPSSSISKYLNGLIITLSLIAQFPGVYNLIALSP